MAKRRRGKPLAPDDPRRRGMANLIPIKPGEVRNATGKNGSEWLMAFREFAADVDSMPQGKGKKKIDGERAYLVRLALFRNAIRGETQAQKIFIEQLQGRPRQSVEVSGPGGGPISTHAKTSAELRKELADLLGPNVLEDDEGAESAEGASGSPTEQPGNDDDAGSED